MRDPPPTPAQALVAARRLLVKIGSALLAAEDGEGRRPWVGGLADRRPRLRSRGARAHSRAKAARRSHGTAPPRARGAESPRPPRHHRCADLADPGRYG